MALPLRLAAEPVARSKLGNCFILPSKEDESKVCLVVGEQGLLCLACNKQYSDVELAELVGLESCCLPSLRLVIKEGTENPVWSGDASKSSSPTEVTRTIRNKSCSHLLLNTLSVAMHPRLKLFASTSKWVNLCCGNTAQESSTSTISVHSWEVFDNAATRRLCTVSCASSAHLVR